MDMAIVERLEELGLNDFEIAVIKFMYESNSITEKDIFDIGEDEEFNFDNLQNYELNEQAVYDDSNYNLAPTVTYADESYFVFDNYEDAEKAAIEDTKYLIDDIGVTGINFGYLAHPMTEYVDQDWFEQAERESFEIYCYDLMEEGNDPYGNSLVERCYEVDIINDDDFEEDEDGNPDYSKCKIDDETLLERAVDEHMDGIDDFIEYFIDEFGEAEFNDVVSRYGLIDEDKLAEDVVDVDGPANSLASYDGRENEVDLGGLTYYLYRFD